MPRCGADLILVAEKKLDNGLEDVLCGEELLNLTLLGLDTRLAAAVLYDIGISIAKTVATVARAAKRSALTLISSLSRGILLLVGAR